MRYLCDTQIESINDCKSDRFVVRLSTKKYALMNKLGQIYDYDFDEIEPRDDGCYEVKISGEKILIDSECNVIASGFKDVGEFSNDGIATVYYNDGSSKWINRDGSVFGEGLKPVNDFINGIGVVQHEDTSLQELVYIPTPEKLNNLGEHETLRDDGLVLSGLLADGFSCFLNKNYSWVESFGRSAYLIDRTFKKIAGPFERVFDIFDNDVALCYEHDKVTGHPQYFFFDIARKKRLFEPFKYFSVFDGEIARVPCFDRNYHFINQNGEPINNKGYFSASEFSENLSIITEISEITHEHQMTYLRKNGTMFKNWYDVCSDESEGLCAVQNKNRGFYLNEFEEMVGKSFYRTYSFHEGNAVVQARKGEYTYIDRNFKRFVESFDHAGDFSCGFGVVKNDGVYDAVNKNQIRLSSISGLVKEIETDPEMFLNLPTEVYEDLELLEELFNFAIDVCEKYRSQFDGEEYKTFVDKKIVSILNAYSVYKENKQLGN